MPYFTDNYQHIRFPVQTDGAAGLRRAQLGAIHALAAHFIVRAEPALVSMPTGSGKTAVLMMTGYLERANRVLVVTPSRLVRNQIAEGFAELGTLTDIGVYPTDAPKPAVHEIENRITTELAWQALRNFDVVVATPNSISPGLEGVPPPPDDLFDLLLVDEAHHSPASTWNALLESFPERKKALFTATPFRRDRREINGRLIFHFPLREAHKDGIFGNIRYVPISPLNDEPHDLAVAKAAAATLRADQANGLDHLLMVRTDSKKRATELMELYEQHTGLRLRLIHSGHSYSHIKSSIKKLRARELDGIVCVDMLGEGFDLPNLKIAAIHAPHRSLEVTLQFIGRFARTGGANLGEAKFLAVPSDILIETERLYREDAIWQDIVVDLSQSRITEEQDVREKLDTFEPPTVVDFTTEDLSLYSLKPYCHVKIFRASDPVDIQTPIVLPAPFEIVYQQVSPELSAAVLIARELEKPRWTQLDAFHTLRYELFLIYYHEETKLLFVNCSRRNESLYEEIAGQYSEVFFPLSLSKINRVLRGMENTKFFNIGMKNRILNSNTESYRIISGSQAEKAVGQTDGHLYHRGHVFGRGDEEGRATTIGYSSLSKVWSNQNLQLPNAIAWCQSLAQRIANDAPVVTRSGLDHLSVGQEINDIPGGVIAAEWDSDAYRNQPVVVFHRDDGHLIERQMLDFDLRIDHAHCSNQQVQAVIVGPDVCWRIAFRLTGTPRFQDSDGCLADIRVQRNQEEMPLLRYLNVFPLHFYFSDLSRLQGNELFAYAGGVGPYPTDEIEHWDWNAANVDIEREFWEGDISLNGKVSVQDHLASRLNSPENEVVLYDHRTGELADFVTATELGDCVQVGFYHCKGSGGPNPGNRVEDVYEVCGQAVKCIVWFDNSDRLLRKIEHRLLSGSYFIRGDLDRLRELLTTSTKPVRYQVAMIQPGISKNGLSDGVGRVLAGVRDYLHRARSERLRVIGSA